ncbi:hypothetical protein BJ878DRAFT_525915 [Calycina marina]|uniref:SAP domain-containing protein n=1 Tax=Calycina marina TaxID=1763456 RepID=A0A9P8CB29_9HELO|nr:hypothetical protein BJ878DRAFT_525915 [Calycina marina]
MTDWNKSKVVDLRAELQSRGLVQTGLKPALVARLEAADSEDGSESEATIKADNVNIDASAATSHDSLSAPQRTNPSAARPEESHTTKKNAEVVAPVDEESVASSPTTEPLPTPQADTREDESPVAQSEALVDSPLPTPQADTREDEPPVAQSDVLVDSAPDTNNGVQDADTLAKTNAHGSKLPSVEPEEAIADRQKRKRRSESPLPSTQDVRKRIRQDGVENNLDMTSAKGEDLVDFAEPTTTALEEEQKKEVEMVSEQAMDIDSKEHIEESLSRPKDSRFKDLFLADMPRTEANNERTVSPAIHPATAALYIRNFMRPLNPQGLKAHLISLSAPPGQEPDKDVIVDFHLDSIRTHGFVSFTNTAAASRVRSALHNLIWPDERNRKPLWVDFIPVERVTEWIEEEEVTKAGSRAPALKWEVVYYEGDDGSVIARLQVQDGTNRPSTARQPSFSGSGQIPSGPRSDIPTGPRALALVDEAALAARLATSIATLDQHFKSTIALPKLYWKPVREGLVQDRLDSIDDITSKSYDRHARPGSEINRYTFEDGAKVVDRGTELFPGLRPPPGFRGPQFDGGRGPPRGGGGFRGRGDYGGLPRRGNYDSYRGGGGRLFGSRYKGRN